MQYSCANTNIAHLLVHYYNLGVWGFILLTQSEGG